METSIHLSIAHDRFAGDTQSSYADVIVFTPKLSGPPSPPKRLGNRNARAL